MNDPTHWWTHEGLEAPKGRLHIAGRDADALAREHGTPLYVFDLNRVEANFRRIEGAFERAGVRHQLLYALKSNRNPKVLGRVRSLGFAGADVCSPNEVDIALENGWRPDEISYTGTSLSDRDLDRILRHPVTLNLDSLSAIRRVGARGPGRRIGLRINPGVGAGFSSKLTYSGEKPTKFGIYPDQFGEALDLAQQHRLEVRYEVIADHHAEELESILDSQRVIERMREAGTEPVVVSKGDDSGRGRERRRSEG